MKLLLSILTALAVLLMPAGMQGAAMAATHDVAAGAGMGHCADKPEPAKEKPPESCCLVACSALPAEPVGMTSLPSPAIAPAAAVPAGLAGLSAEAATPPPRSS